MRITYTAEDNSDEIILKNAKNASYMLFDINNILFRWEKDNWTIEKFREYFADELIQSKINLEY